MEEEYKKTFERYFMRKQLEKYVYKVRGVEGTRSDILNNMQYYFLNELYLEVPDDFLNLHSLIPSNDEDRTRFNELLLRASKQGLS